jgi:hypothetical protein
MPKDVSNIVVVFEEVTNWVWIKILSDVRQSDSKKTTKIL